MIEDKIEFIRYEDSYECILWSAKNLGKIEINNGSWCFYPTSHFDIVQEIGHAGLIVRLVESLQKK